MNEQFSPISSQFKQDWRDYLLGKVVAYLEQNKENILSEFQIKNGQNPDATAMETSGLLDFDVSITLHIDRKTSFGSGSRLFQGEPNPLIQLHTLNNVPLRTIFRISPIEVFQSQGPQARKKI